LRPLVLAVLVMKGREDPVLQSRGTGRYTTPIKSGRRKAEVEGTPRVQRNGVMPSSRAVRSAVRSRPGDDHNPILGDLMRDRIVPPTDGGCALKGGGSPREVLRYIERAERLLRR
jgi:hypothetical protein